MRLRNKPWAKPLIEANPQWVVTNPSEYRGKWQERFEKAQPLYIEVGMGKGRFIVEMAKKYPHYNFIGLEMQTVATGIALKKQLVEQLPNLQLVCANGAGLTEFFATDEVAGIYLNFSDPWPKNRQEKRRLTYKSFLAAYKEIMVADGQLEFKTDNRGLFEYSLASLNNFGMTFEKVWLDLHADEEAVVDNVMTEYEEKFSSKGQPIYKLAARF
ncbi:tRNA (guanosine(46)-N7)-methyltransferase TrmB [Ligilactobacillus agilis]|uniref:tRNA (guanine-N(7)-)-methyltransferase n=1 Tax=Ligilactobacillus agilis DSM 20509 TaxID=1423718 RepID=A0A0R2ACH5_9LACO|nr:tRNA (guanosine(46)-N7)-methyltransferase TrmB [Ligilactobacillus agilis]KRM65150.1 tRNA (m(7)G46) methyltransferase [Ligilactobacillus agilis DSM 20509]MBL1056706.1 tRNA (guanosine(46)-N7)-methyltransferase TrmB [Ligilactobacillus agilis]MDO4455337.1 tRNA (guanosine(46)-N7)-methyltransferase TrmB [Ligilactobacillus agilis]MDY4065210.1 tRNA (guanosine(46)-N7)-methyltransferase TrmB [Ligilactobacillus agilis]GET14311.1 tRNA (guanine-N(7)-)-methyltransferase [Ligilactobacillus agilis]